MLERFVDSTQWKIVFLLKKNGEMSVEEVGKILNITPIGVRQHILNLSKNGFVTYRIQKHGVGRPSFIYTLTEKASELFPHNYGVFTLDILKAIEEIDGRKKISLLLKRRKETILNEKRKLLANISGPVEKMLAFFQSLKDDGYLIDLIDDGNTYKIFQYNCPLSQISSQYREVCRYELELYRELLSPSIERKMCYAEGDRYCLYTITKNRLIQDYGAGDRI